MAKIKNKGYSIETVKRILPHLKEDSMRIILTEHFLEKMGHRCMDGEKVCEKLENHMPKSIVKYRDSDVNFELTYDWDDEDLAVVLSARPPHSVIMISAYFKEVFDEDC